MIGFISQSGFDWKNDVPPSSLMYSYLHQWMRRQYLEWVTKTLNAFASIVPFWFLWHVSTTQSIPHDFFICLQNEWMYLDAFSAFLRYVNNDKGADKFSELASLVVLAMDPSGSITQPLHSVDPFLLRKYLPIIWKARPGIDQMLSGCPAGQIMTCSIPLSSIG